MGKNRKLINACGSGNLEEARKAFEPSFLSKGADPNARTYNGTALTIACDKGHSEIVKLLVEKGADVNIADGRGRSPLVLALDHFYYELASYLLDHGADPDARWMPGRDTALMKCAERGAGPMVRLLIKKGADVNAANAYGRTAMTIALENSNLDLVKLLLECNSKIDLDYVRDSWIPGRLISYGNADLLGILVESGLELKATQKSDPLIVMACQHEHLEIISLLLEKGADINETGRDGTTALMAAVRTGKPEIVRCLLDHGADVNHISGNGTGVLDASCGGWNIPYEVRRMLIMAGAPVHPEHENQIVLLKDALKNGDAEIADLLENKGLHLDPGDFPGVFEDAALKGHLASVIWLENKGMVITELGDKLLAEHFVHAASKGYLPLVQHLISQGIDINIKDDNHETALMKACENGMIGMIELLIGMEADVMVGNEYNETAFIYARLCNDKALFCSIIRLLVRNLKGGGAITEAEIENLWQESGKYHVIKQQRLKELAEERARLWKIRNGGRESTAKGSIGHDLLNVKTLGALTWEERFSILLAGKRPVILNEIIESQP